jgi:hypothetical protein
MLEYKFQTEKENNKLWIGINSKSKEKEEIDTFGVMQISSFRGSK